MNKEQKIQQFYTDVENDLLNRCHDEITFSLGKEKSFANCFLINQYDQFEVFYYECGEKKIYRKFYNIETAALNFAVRITKNYYEAKVVKELIVYDYKKYFKIKRLNLDELYDLIRENSLNELENLGHYRYSRKSFILIEKFIKELNKDLDGLATETSIDLKFSELIIKYTEMFQKLKSKMNKNRKNKYILKELSSLSLVVYNCYLEDREKYNVSKEEYLEQEEMENIDSVNYESVYRYVKKKLSN